jgi:hypothetical protein
LRIRPAGIAFLALVGVVCQSGVSISELVRGNRCQRPGHNTGTAFPRETVVSTFEVQGRITRPSSRQRSKITNGNALVAGSSGRGAWVRRAKDVINLHTSDLGGIDNTSAAERSIIRRIATLTVELEMMESRFAAVGQASSVDLDLYQRTAGNLRRLLEAIGMQRRQKNITPTLSEYLKMKATDIEAAE